MKKLLIVALHCTLTGLQSPYVHMQLTSVAAAKATEVADQFPVAPLIAESPLRLVIHL